MNTERYQRQLVLQDFGVAGQEKLRQAKVLVVGAGGLGVPVMQYLVGMGVGALTLVDEDVISLSNLQRQVLYATDDVGKRKVEVASERLNQLNPEVEIATIDRMLSRENAKSIVSEHHIVVDCTDSIESRYVINDICTELSIPFVYGALYRHEGHVSVFNYNGSPNYRDIYPDDSAKVENCNEIGVLGVLPGIIGCYQAMETVKVVTGIGDSLAGKLLVVDALSTEHSVFQLAPNPTKKRVVEPLREEDNLLSWEDLDGMSVADYHLIDVRSESEYAMNHDDRFGNISLAELNSFNPGPKNNIVLVCNRGNATRQASTLIKAGYPEANVYQIKGGYSTQ